MIVGSYKPVPFNSQFEVEEFPRSPTNYFLPLKYIQLFIHLYSFKTLIKIMIYRKLFTCSFFRLCLVVNRAPLFTQSERSFLNATLKTSFARSVYSTFINSGRKQRLPLLDV